MKYLFVLSLITISITLSAQTEIELNPDGIVVPRTTTGAVSSPVEGLLIYDTSANSYKYYNGNSWQDIGASFFEMITGGIRYLGGNVALGNSSSSGTFSVWNDGSQDLVRLINDQGTQFRIFDNGAISLGSNWGSPQSNVIRLQGSKVIVTDTLVMQGENIIMRHDGTMSFYDGGIEKILINPDNNGDGRISTDELQINGGSDLAELFDIHGESSTIKPGMVVSIADANGNLQLSNTKRDKRVVGITSGANGIKPGMFMGQSGTIATGEHPVAITGRVYVHANTENGKISAGDFLTTSSQAGYAMRVKRMKKSQGAIIGKALTSLDEKEGFVLVLVNLQ